MSKTEEFISDYIDENKDVLISKIQQAIRIKSLTGQEQKMQQFMKGLYVELGLTTIESEPDFNKVSKHSAFIDSGFPIDDRKNIIGIYEGGKGRSLTLHGHADVVPPEPVSAWSYDPWGGEIVGNRLYGRGSLDMKSGLLANWFALKTLLDLNIKPKGTIQLHSTIEEEAGGGLGALSCLEEGYITDGFITTEPQGLRVAISHAGILYFRVKVFGRTAHAARTQEGINAIGKMYKIYHGLMELDKKRAKEIEFPLFSKSHGGPPVNINIGTIKAGDWVSNVPGEATIEVRIGFIPGETREQIKKIVKDTIDNISKDDPWLESHPPILEWYGWSGEPWFQDPNDPYIVSFLQKANETLKTNVEIIGMTGGLDSRFTQYYNKPGLAFGPIGANLHGPDEFVEIDSIISTTKVLANHIVDWVGIQEE